MLELNWVDPEDTVPSVVTHIVSRVESEVSVSGRLSVGNAGFQLSVEHTDDIELIKDKLDTILNEEIDNGRDGWVGQQTDEQITIFIRQLR